MKQRPKKPETHPLKREIRADLRVGINVAIRATLVDAISGNKLHGWVRNLSRGGLYVDCKDGFPQNTNITVDALVREGDRAYHLKLPGWVAHAGAYGMGIQFDELEAETNSVVVSLIKQALNGLLGSLQKEDDSIFRLNLTKWEPDAPERELGVQINARDPRVFGAVQGLVQQALEDVENG